MNQHKKGINVMEKGDNSRELWAPQALGCRSCLNGFSVEKIGNQG
jgi:hypothetical protein